MKGRLVGVFSLAFALALAFFLRPPVATVNAQESPHTGVPQRDGESYAQRMSCPPTDSSGKVPPLKNSKGEVLDKDVNGDGQVDYLLDRWHWDDGKGNDLTVELWCVSEKTSDDHYSYYGSEVVTQSKTAIGKTEEKTVVSPGGKQGGIDPGHC